MVKIELYKAGKHYKGFVVQGHAGAEEPGKDIVCAAISVLFQTALLGLDAYVTKELDWKMEHGYLECWLPESLPLAEQEKVAVILGTPGARARSDERRLRTIL